MATGQLFSRNTQALFYNYKQLPIQRMLDFDFLCGESTFFFLSVFLLDLTVAFGGVKQEIWCLYIFSGRETPSVAGIINPGSEGFQKLFFGQEEIAIPVHAA